MRPGPFVFLRDSYNTKQQRIKHNCRHLSCGFLAMICHSVCTQANWWHNPPDNLNRAAARTPVTHNWDKVPKPKDAKSLDRSLGVMLTVFVGQQTCSSSSRLIANGSFSRCMWENSGLIKFPSVSRGNKTFFFLFTIPWQFASHLLVAVIYSQETKVRLPAAKAFNGAFWGVQHPKSKSYLCFPLQWLFYPTLHPTPLYLFFHYFLVTFNAVEAIDLAKEKTRIRELRWDAVTTAFFFD